MVDINKLDWRNDATHIQVGHTEWNDLVDALINDGYQETKGSYKTTKRDFAPGTYRFDDDKRDTDLYLVNWAGELVHFYSHRDDEKNDPEHVEGYRAFEAINKKFLLQYGFSFPSAYGIWPRGAIDKTEKDKKYHYTLEQCNAALRPIIKADEFQSHRKLEHIYKADISSAYPYQLTLPLPTTKGMRGPLKGAIEPPRGYVAYWIKSGHIIEGADGGTDTRRLLKDTLYKDIHQFKPIPEDEVTYLLPYCEFLLTDIINDLYDNRSTNPLNKGIMNSFIGKLCSRRLGQKAYMGHISALVYARHITYMCGLNNILLKSGCYPIMYATDSIMWEGGPCAITDKEKYLGAFYLEYADCAAAYKGCGSYVIADPKTGALLLNKHQGISAETWRRANIRSIDEFLSIKYDIREFYNRKTHKYEIRRL